MSETKLIDIKELKFDEHNFNKHNDEGMSLLGKSIKENGLGRSILLDKDNNIVGGNGVTEKAIELGKTKVRIIETDGSELIAVKRTDLTLDSEQGRKMALADNSVAHANLEWNEEELQKAQDEWGLVPEEWGVELPDFGLSDEQAVKSTVDEDNFEIEDNIEKKVNVGDIWQLGSHRLMCGDSTDADAVAKLMNGERADLVFTDPPYGIDVVSDDGKVGADFGVAKKGDYKKVIADETTDTAQKACEILFTMSDKVIVWGGNYFTKFLPFSDGWLIWDKRCDSGIRNTFADGEMAWCSFHTPVRIYHQLWNGMIREGEHEKRVHPTQKPVTMLGNVISDFSADGAIVLDVFGGSGSTMIACEQLGRKCRMMELDPHYCDVIIARWEKLTGNKAEKLEN